MPKVTTYYFLLKLLLRGNRAANSEIGKPYFFALPYLVLILLPLGLLAQAEQANPAGRFWKLNGNYGSNPAINLLGTTDSVPFVIKTNNQQSGIINPLQFTTFFGYWSGINNNTGTQNSALGINSLLFNSAGEQNTAAGTSVLENNTASYNTGIGYLALQSTTTGNNNIAIGNEALSNVTTGYNNVAIGRSAGFGVTDGHHNTFIGDSASAVGSNIYNSTAIGYKAIVTAPNTIVLGRVSDGSVNYGVVAGHTRYNGIGSGTSKLTIAGQGNEEAIVYRFASNTTEKFVTNYLTSRATLTSPFVVAPSLVNSSVFLMRYGSATEAMATFFCTIDSNITSLTQSPLSGRLIFQAGNAPLLSVNPRMDINRRGTLGIGSTFDYYNKLTVASDIRMPYNVLGTGEVKIGAQDSAGIPHPNLNFDCNEIFARIGTSPSTLYLQNEGGAILMHTLNTTIADELIITNDASVMVGIGITPAYQLHMFLNSAAKPTSTLWTVPSDERLKKDIAPYKDGLSQILAIQPVNYNYNGTAGLTTEETGVGTLAAELEKIAPYMIKPFVHKDESGNETTYKSVDYNALLFMCVNAFKQQQLRIEKLKEQNAKLKELLGLKN